MTHRGPDDAGLWESPERRVVLAHRRLSIVDLSPAGHQPMSNEDGKVWITFNGEIYNHLALRPGLEAKGHRFRSRTDTEAIVHQYEEDGDACLDALDGMFAVGIWDAARDRLLLARDRLGKKPLYYTVIGGRLLFASEIKGLLAHPDVPRDIDPEGMNLYLTFGNVPAPHTLFAGIKKLPAGHRLSCDRFGNIRIERYWSAVPAAALAHSGRRRDGGGPGARAAVRSGEEAPHGRRAGGRLPFGRRRFERERRADEPPHRSPVADLFGRLRGIRAQGKLPRPPLRASGGGAVPVRSPRNHRDRRRVPRLSAGARLPAGRAHRRSGLSTDALPLPAGPPGRRHRGAGRRGERRGVRGLRRHGPLDSERLAPLGTAAALAAARAGGPRRGEPGDARARRADGSSPPGPRRSAALLGPGRRVLGQRKGAAAHHRGTGAAWRAPAVAGRRARVATSTPTSPTGSPTPTCCNRCRSSSSRTGCPSCS